MSASRRSPVVDVAYSGGQVLALHDATFSMDPGSEQRNILRLWDPERQVQNYLGMLLVVISLLPEVQIQLLNAALNSETFTDRGWSC